MRRKNNHLKEKIFEKRKVINRTNSQIFTHFEKGDLKKKDIG